LRQAPASPATGRAIGAEFRGLVNTAIGVLLLTGIILSVSRLTSDAVTVPYVAVLAVKVALALYMFYIVRFLRQEAYPEEASTGRSCLSRVRRLLTNTTAVLIVGVIVFGLADVLDMLFEKGLTR
jgi:putative copper export protein